MGVGSERGDVGDTLDADAADALGADLHGGEAEVAGGEGFVAAGRVAEVAGEPRGDGFAGLPLEGPTSDCPNPECAIPSPNSFLKGCLVCGSLWADYGM